MVRATAWRAASCVVMAGAAGIMGMAGGCSTAPKEAPLSAIVDQRAHSGARQRAIESAMDKVAAGEADRESVRESLKKVAWSRNTWGELRRAAVAELMEDQEGIKDTRQMMRLMLPTEKDMGVIALIGTTAVERGWTDLTAALVRCWSRPTLVPPDAERPERAALAGLHPGRPVEDVVYDVFTGTIVDGNKTLDEKQRREAWSLLQRIDPKGERSMALLSSQSAAPEGDAMTATMQRAARELGVAPGTGDELARIQKLGTPEFAAVWRECAAAVAGLSAEQREGLRVRHVIGARWAAANEPTWLAMSREELLNELERTLEPRRQHLRAGVSAKMGSGGEAVRGHRASMLWGDALLGLIAARAIESQAMGRAIFAHAEEDLRDTSTELGGVIDGGAAGAFSIRKFSPRASQRYGDRRFVAPAEMIDQGADALFHYHMHANDYGNSDYAGPSEEDRSYAERFGVACVVFTFIDKSTLNADYFFPSDAPGGVVIDLGEIKRPAGEPARR